MCSSHSEWVGHRHFLQQYLPPCRPSIFPRRRNGSFSFGSTNKKVNPETMVKAVSGPSQACRSFTPPWSGRGTGVNNHRGAIPHPRCTVNHSGATAWGHQPLSYTLTTDPALRVRVGSPCPRLVLLNPNIPIVVSHEPPIDSVDKVYV